MLNSSSVTGTWLKHFKALKVKVINEKEILERGNKVDKSESDS